MTLEQTIARVKDFAKLKSNWNSDGAEKIDHRAIETTIRLLKDNIWSDEAEAAQFVKEK